MPFDMGFNFRATSGFVTDPAYGVPVLLETYPHTYTNANGDSVNGGASPNLSGATFNASATNDPRIAGCNYHGSQNVTGEIFQVDLASGSAPGAGTYSVDCAFGSAAGFGTTIEDFQIRDNVAVLIDGTNGGSGYTIVDGHFIDATLTEVVASTTWTGTPVSKAFASTVAIVKRGVSAIPGFFAPLAHFRLTKASSPTFTGNIGSWINTEVGHWFQGLTHQFDNTILARWKTEAQAAKAAGAPFPRLEPELKQWFLEFLLTQP